MNEKQTLIIIGAAIGALIIVVGFAVAAHVRKAIKQNKEI